MSTKKALTLSTIIVVMFGITCTAFGATPATTIVKPSSDKITKANLKCADLLSFNKWYKRFSTAAEKVGSTIIGDSFSTMDACQAFVLYEPKAVSSDAVESCTYIFSDGDLRQAMLNSTAALNTGPKPIVSAKDWCLKVSQFDIDNPTPTPKKNKK